MEIVDRTKSTQNTSTHSNQKSKTADKEENLCRKEMLTNKNLKIVSYRTWDRHLQSENSSLSAVKIISFAEYFQFCFAENLQLHSKASNKFTGSGTSSTKFLIPWCNLPITAELQSKSANTMCQSVWQVKLLFIHLFVVGFIGVKNGWKFEYLVLHISLPKMLLFNCFKSQNGVRSYESNVVHRIFFIL